MSNTKKLETKINSSVKINDKNENLSFKNVNKTILSNIKEATKFNKKFENDEFLSLLKKTKLNQQVTLEKLKEVKVKQKLKLPEKISDIDRDPYLSSVLLKNPEFMNVEEKNFIHSFNKKEKAIFFEYLKTKSKERNWMGNGYGSGNFLHDTKKFLENKKVKEESKLPFFKQFLKGFLDQTKTKNENESKLITNQVS
jgi:hypothetical protein